MACFEIVEGAPGQGKSLYTAKLIKKLAKRNLKWAVKTGQIRKICTNITLNETFVDDYREFIHYWKSPTELVQMLDCDVIWDEIATELDSRNFANLPDELKIFLSQYRKRGVDIYANTQDFSMVDARARLMVTRVATLSKMIGSGDPSPTKPPVKRIWGLVAVREVENFKETNPTKKEYGWIPSFFFIDRVDIELYDTRQAIFAGQLPIKKLRKQVERYEPLDPNDKPFERVKYI